MDPQELLARVAGAAGVNPFSVAASNLGLTTWQYELVYNVFSFTFAAMGAAFIYFILVRKTVSPNYRSAVTMSAIICGIAAYHYWRIFSLWSEGATNEGYRYADWLLTVPLLLAELVVVSGIARNKRTGMITKLVVAALLMVALGYPGEVAPGGSTARTVWGILSSIPFLYILYVLFVELGKAAGEQKPATAKKLMVLRILIIFIWGVYPIAYILGDPNSWLSDLFNLSAADSQVVRQVMYSVADVLAKPAYGLIIYSIARSRTRDDGWTSEDTETETEAAAA
ncbi:MAG: bacteriorhodopsin [Acidimicrobiia bacterium]